MTQKIGLSRLCHGFQYYYYYINITLLGLWAMWSIYLLPPLTLVFALWLFISRYQLLGYFLAILGL
jgi:hypothetical protein